MKNDLPISTENILDHMSEGVYVCDRNRRIVYWSKSSERITGRRSEDVLGRACHENILCHEDKDGNPKKLKSKGITLGVMEDIPDAAAYHEQTAALASGDAILIFSDGAFEIHDANFRSLIIFVISLTSPK
jgi:PAS domain-containing protein